MIDFSKIKTMHFTSVEIYEPARVDGAFITRFRSKHNLTQSALANIMGVSHKTILRWERRKKPINGSAAVLLSLLNDNDELVGKTYSPARRAKGVQKKTNKQEEQTMIILNDLTNHSPLSVLVNARYGDYWEDMKADDDSDCVELIKLYGDKKSAMVMVGVDRYTEDDTMQLYIEAWVLPDGDKPDEGDEPLAIEWIGEPDYVTEEDILFAFLSVFSRAEEYLAEEDKTE